MKITSGNVSCEVKNIYISVQSTVYSVQRTVFLIFFELKIKRYIKSFNTTLLHYNMVLCCDYAIYYPGFYLKGRIFLTVKDFLKIKW